MGIEQAPGLNISVQEQTRQGMNFDEKDHIPEGFDPRFIKAFVQQCRALGGKGLRSGPALSFDELNGNGSPS